MPLVTQHKLQYAPLLYFDHRKQTEREYMLFELSGLNKHMNRRLSKRLNHNLKHLDLYILSFMDLVH